MRRRRATTLTALLSYIVKWLLFAIAIVAAMTVVAVATKAFVGESEEVAPQSAQSNGCVGEFYDTHAHLDEAGFGKTLAQRMQAHNVGCALVLAHVDLAKSADAFLQLRGELAEAGSRFVPFFDVLDESLTQINRASLESLYAKHQGSFRGVGEFTFDRPPLQGSSLTSAPWPTVFDFAGQKDLFVMIHLTGTQTQQLEQILTEYSQTKVLLAGNELLPDLVSLLHKHQNLYLTIDTASLLKSYGSQANTNLMYPAGDPGAVIFYREFDALHARLLDEAVRNWLPIIEAAPQRVMWGTDVSFSWHLEPSVYQRLIGFSRDFIDRLPEQYRKPYASENARRLIGPAVQLQPLSRSEQQDLRNLQNAD